MIIGKRILAWSATIACMAVSQQALAGEAPTANVGSNGEFGVPVFPYDITDRPYTVIGEVKAGIRKATIFSKAPDQGKVYRELWERAQKLGADAVVKAQYGDPRMTAMSWGSVSATGTAIKFNEPTAPQPAQ